MSRLSRRRFLIHVCHTAVAAALIPHSVSAHLHSSVVTDNEATAYGYGEGAFGYGIYGGNAALPQVSSAQVLTDPSERTIYLPFITKEN